MSSPAKGLEMVKRCQANREDRVVRGSPLQYQVSGRLYVKMSDGSEFELGPGDVSYLPSGHDAWVVSDEPVVLVDWYGAGNYAKET